MIQSVLLPKNYRIGWSRNYQPPQNNTCGEGLVGLLRGQQSPTRDHCGTKGRDSKDYAIRRCVRHRSPPMLGRPSRSRRPEATFFQIVCCIISIGPTTARTSPGRVKARRPFHASAVSRLTLKGPSNSGGLRIGPSARRRITYTTVWVL